MIRFPCLIAAAGIAALLPVAATAAPPGETEIQFEAQSGETVAAFAGSFTVPENRLAADSRELTLSYIRFPATGDTSGPPIIYLAGGPGGSGIGTARARRFPLFQAMREFGDVIALDQRGTGQSADVPPCTSSVHVPEDRGVSDSELIRLYQQALKECVDEWSRQSVDVLGYTTVQNAADLNSLREHLGAEKMVLWGTSYGSHLALAALKDFEPVIDRVVISSAEGLDQTVKRPSETDAYFDRLQVAVNTDAAAAAVLPDIKAMIRSVHANLDEAPATVTLPAKDGGTTSVVLDRRTIQQIASAMIADPENAVQLLWMYKAVEAGSYEPFQRVMSYFYSPGEPISFQLMSTMMDVASGISEDRLALVTGEARDALLGDALNFPMPQLNRTVDGLDLGDEFRKGPVSDVPTLLLTGTLDGRTYPDGQAEAVAGLSHVTQIMVVNAGHNLFVSSPDVTARIQAFMRRETVSTDPIVISLPDFGVPQP
ncbi:alpha/beta hydrolase [Parvularcula sp. LCG005]|uniref:alpha/beta fold hydrolase n=1 Tax=Parvularcula sp. LCG005 TaxID=3078805 RepID=UPI00294346A8|nr:alpha/beta hydrolase [Parvularcula sp. LCG005]WOI54454.1 alpha/beta hydrolase [Parvularcula sp. LCG005]